MIVAQAFFESISWASGCSRFNLVPPPEGTASKEPHPDGAELDLARVLSCCKLIASKEPHPDGAESGGRKDGVSLGYQLQRSHTQTVRS